ncbi:hypothetical protein [Actinoplanes sp. GCM10030250]|uniref:hypothetical protein n=1 Tax=Actinoplanes sp. GCM10030250 TaxID=3273376 RepID=UPI003621AB51
MAIGASPALQALIDINAVSLARTELDPPAMLLVWMRTSRMQDLDFPHRLLRPPVRRLTHTAVTLNVRVAGL